MREMPINKGFPAFLLFVMIIIFQKNNGYLVILCNTKCIKMQHEIRRYNIPPLRARLRGIEKIPDYQSGICSSLALNVYAHLHVCHLFSYNLLLLQFFYSVLHVHLILFLPFYYSPFQNRTAYRPAYYCQLSINNTRVLLLLALALDQSRQENNVFHSHVRKFLFHQVTSLTL